MEFYLVKNLLQGCSYWSSIWNVDQYVRVCSLNTEPPSWNVHIKLLWDNTAVESQFVFYSGEFMSLVYPFANNKFSMDNKASAMKSQGFLVINQKNISFSNALANIDFTKGIMKRRTDWFWNSFAFLDKENNRIGIQLSQGIYDDVKGYSLESAIWVNDRIFPHEEIVIFTVPDDPLTQMWNIQNSQINLTFTPAGAHLQTEWFPGFIDIDMKHCFGRIQGTLQMKEAGKLIEIDTIGTAEDHKSLW